MLTPKEISDRRKARRLLDRKGIALEETVERRLCQSMYNRIWRHRATLDEVRDEKLRSRTAALALVGIGLQDLGIDFDQQPSESDKVQVEAFISRAREGLLRMNDAKYPLGKLQQLAAAHKNIVDLLTALHQSSSSADEILPALIYTLITTPPEGINVISNLNFVQRFRAASKVDGFQAYCLVNLEAAITFLETVDLASLRSDEAQSTSHNEAWISRTPTRPAVSSTSSATSATSDQLASPHPLEPPSVTVRISPIEAIVFDITLGPHAVVWEQRSLDLSYYLNASPSFDSEESLCLSDVPRYVLNIQKDSADSKICEVCANYNSFSSTEIE